MVVVKTQRDQAGSWIFFGCLFSGGFLVLVWGRIWFWGGYGFGFAGGFSDVEYIDFYFILWVGWCSRSMVYNGLFFIVLYCYDFFLFALLDRWFLQYMLCLGAPGSPLALDSLYS